MTGPTEMPQTWKDWVYGQPGCTCNVRMVNDHFERGYDGTCPVHPVPKPRKVLSRQQEAHDEH